MKKEGRPTKLNEQVLKDTQSYIDSCVDDRKNNEVNLPTIEGLAYELRVNKTTIYEWRKGLEEIHIKFSNLIEDLLQKQARQLVNCGLSGTYNPTIAKVLLTKHGYREGTDITTDGKEIVTKNFTDEERTNLLALLDDKEGTH